MVQSVLSSLFGTTETSRAIPTTSDSNGVSGLVRNLISKASGGEDIKDEGTSKKNKKKKKPEKKGEVVEKADVEMSKQQEANQALAAAQQMESQASAMGQNMMSQLSNEVTNASATASEQSRQSAEEGAQGVLQNLLDKKKKGLR